jgi:hypothetical protein
MVCFEDESRCCYSRFNFVKKKGATPTKPHIVTSPSFFLPKKRQGDVLILIDWLQRIQQVNQVEGV